MNVQMFFMKIAEVVTSGVITEDQRCREAYLVWARARWPRMSRLEDLFFDARIKTYFNEAVRDALMAYLGDHASRPDSRFVLDAPAHYYFEVDPDEPCGVSSHVIGEMRKQVLPRLQQGIAEYEAENIQEDLHHILANALGAAFNQVRIAILDHRSTLTDAVTYQLFT